VKIDAKGNIYINNVKLDEHYGKEEISDPGNAEKGIILGSNEFFVLGDNRNNSIDSRLPEVGKVNEKQIIGKVLFY